MCQRKTTFAMERRPVSRNRTIPGNAFRLDPTSRPGVDHRTPTSPIGLRRRPRHFPPFRCPEKPSPFPARSSFSMAKPRILIVDDDRTACQLLARLLEGEGFEPISCADGREALQLIDSAQPALIVSDYEMPEFTGAQLCELVRSREDPELASLPIILLTAHGGEQHEVESLEAGANDFVTKPVNLAVLKARIDTHLRLHSLLRQLEQQNTQPEQWRHSRSLEFAAAQITPQ